MSDIFKSLPAYKMTASRRGRTIDIYGPVRTTIVL